MCVVSSVISIIKNNEGVAQKWLTTTFFQKLNIKQI